MKNQRAKQLKRSSLGRIARLTRKELRETLRDRRTVITLVLMPLLVYPLLSISFNKSLLLTTEQTAKTVYSIGVDTRRDAANLERLLIRGTRLLDFENGPSADTGPDQEESSSTAAVSPKLPAEAVDLRWFDDASLERHVANLDVQLAVRVQYPEGEQAKRQRAGPWRYELIYRENSPISEQAMRFVRDRLQAVNEASLRARLARMGAFAGVPADVSLKPITVGSSAPFSLATLVPLVLILMTITGAVYPAIDLTAGERERGTLETLIAAPISRLALLVAKYAAVLVVAVLTAMVNLVAMTVTLLTSSLGSQLFPDELSPILMIQILGLMILFAAFFSAIVLALTSFARSFKEAQAYLIPVMLLAISPGLLSLMPGLELSGMLAVAPLVNMVLLSRDILEGNVVPTMAALAIGSTAIYAAAAIAVASKIFGNDALFYASRGSWSELFQRPITQRAAPTPAATIACLATLFPLYFVLANLAQSRSSDVRSQLWLNAMVTIVVFGVWPLLFAVAQRVRFLAGFQIRPAGVLAFVGALVFGLALWPIAQLLFLLGKWAGLVAIDKHQFALVDRLLEAFQGISPGLIVVMLAVIPAASEEFFFRGYLFHGLRQRFSGRSIIVVSALLFGLFHVLSPSVLTPERFLPSTFLGLVLGWVCYRTQSVLPGMLLHGCHNAVILLMVQNRELLKTWGWNYQQTELFPKTWLLASGLAIAVAVLLVFLSTRRKSVAAKSALPAPQPSVE